MASTVRALVSRKKIRYNEGGFDLDLTYITPRIIALGAPSEGSDALFRNPLAEVQRFLESRHAGKYWLFDLRAEAGVHYDAAKFGGRVSRHGFFDHNPAPLATIAAAVADMHRWLSADPANVAAVHCKAGKGRTGLIVSAYLVFAGLAPSATAALRAFGDARTSNGKGVTIPSQMRYVHYYEASLHRRVAPATYRLRHLRMHTVPNFDVGGGCDPFFYVLLGDGKRLAFNWKEAACGGKPPHFMPKHQLVDFDLSPFNVRVAGDVKIIFFDYDHFSAPDKMFHFWFNTGFIADNYLLFHKDVLDRASKDKDCREFAPDFKLEIFIDRVDDVAGEFADAAAGASIDDNDNDLDKDEADEE